MTPIIEKTIKVIKVFAYEFSGCQFRNWSYFANSRKPSDPVANQVWFHSTLRMPMIYNSSTGYWEGQLEYKETFVGDGTSDAISTNYYFVSDSTKLFVGNQQWLQKAGNEDPYQYSEVDNNAINPVREIYNGSPCLIVYRPAIPG